MYPHCVLFPGTFYIVLSYALLSWLGWWMVFFYVVAVSLLVLEMIFCVVLLGIVKLPNCLWQHKVLEASRCKFPLKRMWVCFQSRPNFCNGIARLSNLFFYCKLVLLPQHLDFFKKDKFENVIAGWKFLLVQFNKC